VHGNNLINVGVSFDEQCNYLQQPHSVNIVGQGDCDHRKHHHQNVMYLLKIGLNKCFKAKIANNGLKIVQKLWIQTPTTRRRAFKYLFFMEEHHHYESCL